MVFSLHEDLFHGPVTHIDRKVWTQFAVTDMPDTAVIFLDAELYIDRVQAPAVIQQQCSHAIAVYVSNKNAAARHVDYTCNPTYATFIAEEVLPWVLKRHPTLNPSKIMLAGLSLSGLAAADIAICFPDRFLEVICQSPSFWWEDERFCRKIPPKPDKSSAFWISVGDQETQSGVIHPPSGLRQDTTQKEACKHVLDVLLQCGYSITHREFRGGHDPVCWRDDLKYWLQWISAATAPTSGA